MIYNLALVPPAGLSQDVHEKDSDMNHSVITIKEAVFSDICTMVLQVRIFNAYGFRIRKESENRFWRECFIIIREVHFAMALKCDR